MKDIDPNDPLHVTTRSWRDGNDCVFGDPGLLYSTMIDYWQRTGDSQHNDVVAKGILAQRGPRSDYSQLLFNGSWTDLAAPWGLAAMAAAEHKLPHPGKDKGPGWLELADNVFNRLVSRWDSKYCGGVLSMYNGDQETFGYINLDTSKPVFLLSTQEPQLTDWRLDDGIPVQPRRQARSIHRQRNLRRLGQQGLGLYAVQRPHRKRLLDQLRARQRGHQLQRH